MPLPRSARMAAPYVAGGLPSLAQDASTSGTVFGGATPASFNTSVR